MELRKTDVDSINVSQDVRNQQKWHQSQGHLAIHRVFFQMRNVKASCLPAVGMSIGRIHNGSLGASPGDLHVRVSRRQGLDGSDVERIIVVVVGI